MMRIAFPDFRFELEDLIAEGDEVAVRLSVSGTHRGEMMGMAPTGKGVTASGIEVFRFQNGKIAEHWAAFDALGMLRQIGVIPVPTPGLLVRTLIHQVKRRVALTRSSSMRVDTAGIDNRMLKVAAAGAEL
jgi:hypothetical protein